MATTFSTTNLCGLAAAATPRARRARQHQTYPVRHINSSGLDAVKLSGSRGSHTRNAVGGGVSGGSLVEQGGFFNDCSRAASAAGVGVAACNSGNGVGGAREARTLRKRESRSAYQRREAAAGAVDGEARYCVGPWPRIDESSTLVKPKVSGTKLQARIISALVLGGFGGFVTLSGGLVFALSMSVTSFMSAREYFTMTATMTNEIPHPQPKWASDLCIVLCASLSTFLHLAGNKLTILVMLTTGAFSVISTLLITKQEDPHFAQFCATLFGIFYCGFLPAFWVKIRALAMNSASAGSKKLVASQNLSISGGSLVESWPTALGGPEVWTTGLVVTIIAVLCIISADVGAYCFGKTFGKHQLTAISPNKTIEGAAGGLLSVVATAFGLRYLLGWHAGVIQTLCLGVVIFWSSVVGDLIESVMKRNAGMKDSGDVIPGHGGFLDRFDSYMFTGVAVYFYIVTIMPQLFQGFAI